MQQTFTRPLIRPDPVGPSNAYKTYGILSPLSTHWRAISCEEAYCAAIQHGFKIEVDEATDLGRKQAEYLRRRSGRPCREERTEAGTTVFRFAPGTRCFEQHFTRRARPPLYVVRGGDWRQYLGDPTVHNTPQDWVDDFSTHQDRIKRG